MHDLPPEIEVSPVQHRPILNASADHLGLIGLINHSGPTAMDVDAGTVGPGLVWETLRGRSPRYRLEACCAGQDTAWLLGQAIPPPAFHDDAVGRGRDRLDAVGTMQRFTACAVRAAARFGLECRSGHVETPSRRVWGDSQFPEEQDLPCQGTYGDSQDQRPDLTPCVLSPMGVDRAVPS